MLTNPHQNPTVMFSMFCYQQWKWIYRPYCENDKASLFGTDLLQGLLFLAQVWIYILTRDAMNGIKGTNTRPEKACYILANFHNSCQPWKQFDNKPTGRFENWGRICIIGVFPKNREQTFETRLFVFINFQRF